MPLGQLHNQGLEHLIDWEHQTITAQRTLDLLKEEMYSHPSCSVLSYTQHFVLKCGVLEDRLSIVLIGTMMGYEFSIMHGHETTNAPSWRPATLSLRCSDELGAQIFLEHSDDHFTHEALERHMIVHRHLMMDIIFHYQ